jgi:hypothetical protein
MSLVLFQLAFAHRLAHSKSLHTLVDLESHIEHGARTPIDRDSVRYLMSLSKNLRKIVTTTDVFMVSLCSIDGLRYLILCIRVKRCKAMLGLLVGRNRLNIQ